MEPLGLNLLTASDQINIDDNFQADLEVAVKAEVAKQMEIMTTQLATRIMARSGGLPYVYTPEIQISDIADRVSRAADRASEISPFHCGPKLSQRGPGYLELGVVHIVELPGHEQSRVVTQPRRPNEDRDIQGFVGASSVINPGTCPEAF
ncbi:hypothetical protein N7481_006742 [Penicillium waksmanii]|uniref:uncharacterized protein n=1 Tax=Penicillium waksmanii TaxID=69791 RepID=UPI0025494FF7|nr:uncharacterized protein N7481_006742 [Penicillium waksmanii]KAJ5984643.1 hypothetical protein N7481_006742 [Penicillium waksmanii]